jgi:hypothetical protein
LVCAESTKPLNSNDDHDQSQSRDVRRSLVEVMQIGVETMQDVVLVALALTTSLAAMLGDPCRNARRCLAARPLANTSTTARGRAALAEQAPLIDMPAQASCVTSEKRR